MKLHVIFIVILSIAFLFCSPAYAQNSFDIADLLSSGILNCYEDTPDSSKASLTEDTLSAVLAEYAKTVGELNAQVKNSYDDDYWSGAIVDFDGDKYPELILSYLNDQNEFMVKIGYRSGANQITYASCRLGVDAGGAQPPVIRASKCSDNLYIHLIYQNSTWGGTIKIGRDNVFDYTDGKLKPIHFLSWLENKEAGAFIYYVDNREDESAFLDIYGIPSTNSLRSSYDTVYLTDMKDLQYKILHYIN